MWRTNLNIVLTVVGTLAVYTAVANVIPQVESEVPEAVEIGGDVTPEELVEIGDELFHGAGGCEACHGRGTRAPDLLGVVGTRCGERVPEMSCEEYLYESLTEPNAYVVEGFQPIMQPMGGVLSDGQIWALVAFLQSQGGEVTVTADRLSGGGGAGGTSAGGAAAAATDPGSGAGDATTSTEPGEILAGFGCTACHVYEGEGGPVGPSVAEVRAAGHDPDYLRRSILDPAADTADGYGAVAGTMPPNFGDRLTAAQLEALIRLFSDEE